MQTKRGKKPKLGPVTKYFAEAIRRVPEVELVVFVDGEGDDRRIWTIIDAPPLDSETNRRVYAVEREAALQGNEDIGFRLINLRQLPHGTAGLHIEGLPVLYQRTPDVA